MNNPPPRPESAPPAHPETLDDYHYELPPELIATHPPDRRDSSRMLVLERATGAISHRAFADLPSLLPPGTLAVLNNSRVIRARLPCPAGEIFLVERTAPATWRCLVKPGRKFRAGARGEAAGARYTVETVEPDGCRILRFDREPDHERHGQIPLPPYLHRPPEPADSHRYQTVYATEEGSVAAPTAGLHFTPEILARIPHTFITLHVGLGTFLPVKTPRLDDHTMHSERYNLPAAAAEKINAARHILAVGTTTVRVLESQPPGPIGPARGSTALFIRPPFTFHHTSFLLTNFHLPRSTLLMLVSAFAGRDLVLRAYREAIARRYRFYSYGDCMLLL